MDPGVVDLDVPEAVPASRPPGPVSRRWRGLRPGERRLCLAVATSLVLGIGSARQLGLPPVDPGPDPSTASARPPAPSPAPVPPAPVAPAAVPVPGADPLTGTSTRLLLVGTGLTAYDVDAAEGATLLSPFPGVYPVLGAAALRGADAVLTASRSGPRMPGPVLLVPGGGTAPRQLGNGSSLVAAQRADAVWIERAALGGRPAQVRLVTAVGDVVLGPLTLPTGSDLVGELPGGLVLRLTTDDRRHPVLLLDPATGSSRQLVDDSADVSVAGDHLVVVRAGGVIAVDGVVRDTVPGVRSIVASTSADLALVTGDGVTVLRTGVDPVELPPAANGCPPVWGANGWLFVPAGAGISALAPAAMEPHQVPAVFGDVPLCVAAAGRAPDVSAAGAGRPDGDGRSGAAAARSSRAAG